MNLTSLLLITIVSIGSAAHADLSPACAREVNDNHFDVVTPGEKEDIDAVKTQLAKKLHIKTSRLVYEQSMLAGDGAASFSVIVYRLNDDKGNWKGFYSVTAYDGTELTSYKLMTD